jgi:predicted RNA-binding Zn-ribbon protein involved in translation (DUF1610 family)
MMAGRAAEVRVKVRYERGHSYTETWEPTEFHCPQCGAASVWVEHAPGDYYEGPNHLCVACGSSFTLPRLSNGQDWQNQQRRAAIRGAADRLPTADSAPQ